MAARPARGDELDASLRATAPAMAREVIAIRDLSKTYGGRGEGVTALSGIDCSVADGEFLSIVGPSGCGKSTLLKILAGPMI